MEQQQEQEHTPQASEEEVTSSVHESSGRTDEQMCMTQESTEAIEEDQYDKSAPSSQINQEGKGNHSFSSTVGSLPSFFSKEMRETSNWKSLKLLCGFL